MVKFKAFTLALALGAGSFGVYSALSTPVRAETPAWNVVCEYNAQNQLVKKTCSSGGGFWCSCE